MALCWKVSFWLACSCTILTIVWTIPGDRYEFTTNSATTPPRDSPHTRGSPEQTSSIGHTSWSSFTNTHQVELSTHTEAGSVATPPAMTSVSGTPISTHTSPPQTGSGGTIWNVLRVVSSPRSTLAMVTSSLSTHSAATPHMAHPASTATPPMVTSSTRPTLPQPSPTPKGEEPLCDFDPCRHLQRPCPEVRQARGRSCRCPGQSLPSAASPADPVVALAVTHVRPQEAGVRWCAPSSALTAFSVWVLRQDGSVSSNSSMSSWARQTSVFGLEAGREYNVCVSSQNGVRVSHTRCVAVLTPLDSGEIALYALAGGCAALLLTALVLSVCLYRQCQRGAVMCTHAQLEPATHALDNPRLISLVSIPNPAYAQNEEQVTAPAKHSAQKHRTQYARG